MTFQVVSSSAWHAQWVDLLNGDFAKRAVWDEYGILHDPMLLCGKQAAEQQFREIVASPFVGTAALAFREATRHHSNGVMRRMARRQLLRTALVEGGCVVDLGCGFGWQWPDLAEEFPSQRFVLIDFSITNMRVCRTLMPVALYPNVLCIHANIANLPLEPAIADLAWSVQVFQHLTPEVRLAALKELTRILKPSGRFYLAWIRPVPALRFLSRLLGRRYHLSGELPSGVYLERYSDAVEQELRAVLPKGQRSLSELLFHPELRLRPRAMWIGALDMFLARTPLAPMLARQAEYSGVSGS